MTHRVNVNSTSRQRAAEVLMLLRIYVEVEYSLPQMAASAKTWDPDDLGRTLPDIAPIRILNEIIEVHIDSAACVSTLARAMIQEEPYRQEDPRQTCIEALEVARSDFSQGKTLQMRKMHLSSDMPNLYQLSAVGRESIVFPELEVVSILLAHQLQASDFDRLFSGEDDVALIPV
jgi:hypothetical protein